MKYRKKPVVIEAIKYEKKHIGRALDFCNKLRYSPFDNEYYVDTLEGFMKVTEGDFIIKGVNGEFYPCKPDIFEKTYEKLIEEWCQEMKNLYIIYDWRDREVLYSSHNETKAYAYIGQLVAKEEYDEDMHMIKIQLDEVEEWNLKNELEKLWLK